MLFALCALFVGLAAGQKIVINGRVDSALPEVNARIASLGCRNVTLPDVALPTAPLLIGVSLADLSTLVRLGTATMWQVDDATVSAEVPLSLADSRLYVDSATPMGGEPISLSMGKSKIQVGFDLTSGDDQSCKTSWNYLNITHLDTIVVHSSDPKYDGKPLPKQITDLIVPSYNKFLKDPQFLALLSKTIDLCQPAHRR